MRNVESKVAVRSRVNALNGRSPPRLPPDISLSLSNFSPTLHPRLSIPREIIRLSKSQGYARQRATCAMTVPRIVESKVVYAAPCIAVYAYIKPI